MLRTIEQIRSRFLTLGRNPGAAAPESGNGLRYVLADAAEEGKARCLVSCLGEPPDTIVDMLVSVAAACRAKGDFPVIVTSELWPGLLAAGIAPVEFIPARRCLPVLAAPEFERHVRRRWSLILAKWGFASEIVLAKSFGEFLDSELQLHRPDGRVTPLPASTEAARSS